MTRQSEKTMFSTKIGSGLFLRRFSINVSVGFVIAILMHYFQSAPIVTRIEDMAVDLMINWNVGISPKPDRAIPYVFIDVDERSYRSWGEPVMTPRDKLAELLRFALTGKPSLVVVDIDTSDRVSTENQMKSANAKLIDAVSSWSSHQQTGDEKGPGNTAVIFVSGVRVNIDKEGGNPERKRSFLDGMINENLNIHRASPLFNKDEYDQTVRRWRLFEPTCNDGVEGIIPSVQLISVAHLKAGQKGIQALERELEHFLPDCLDPAGAETSMEHDRLPRHVTMGDTPMTLGGGRVSNRVVYAIPWSRNTVDARRVGSIPFNGRQVPLVVHLPAETITGSSQAVDHSLLKDRIVVIGGSYFASGDYHNTPTGVMPGALVLINSIHSLLQYGHLKEPPIWIILLMEFVLIAIVSLIFALTDKFLGKLIASTTIVVILLPVSFLVFKHGLWLNFVLPLVAIQIHELFRDWEETLFDRRG